MLKEVTIYGERCSGTNYLEQLLINNFEVTITWNYGWKHFFGFNDLTNSDNVLFIGIVRNIHDWINSFYKEKYHLPQKLTTNLSTFLDSEFYSIYDSEENEIMEDRNIENNENYKNIFELRHIKNKFLVDTMPKLVKNYLLITYDDLVNDFVKTMNKIKECNLEMKANIIFPLNIYYYRNDKNTIFIKKEEKKEKEEKENIITKEMIFSKANLYYEKILFPKMSFEINHNNNK